MNDIFATILVVISCIANVQAQSACDSVIIHSIHYDPLRSDSLVQVVIKNESSVLFDYPAFVLSNAGGDTIAGEDVNFFGLGNYFQSHSLDILMPIPDPLITGGMLSLHYGFSDSIYCQFPNNYQLCPETCRPLRIAMQGTGFPAASHDFEYTVTDTLSQVLVSGTMHIDSADYSAFDTICLDPGFYSLTFNRINSAVVEDVHFRIDPLYGYTGELAITSADTIQLMFGVMTACLETDSGDTTVGIIDVPDDVQDVRVMVQSEGIAVLNHGPQALSRLRLIDLQGRVLHESTSFNDNAYFIPTAELTPGIYLVQWQARNRTYSRKVMVVR